jgi:hypothetical protein
MGLEYQPHLTIPLWLEVVTEESRTTLDQCGHGDIVRGTFEVAETN